MCLITAVITARKVCIWLVPWALIFKTRLKMLSSHRRPTGPVFQVALFYVGAKRPCITVRRGIADSLTFGVV